MLHGLEGWTRETLILSTTTEFITGTLLTLHPHWSWRQCDSTQIVHTASAELHLYVVRRRAGRYSGDTAIDQLLMIAVSIHANKRLPPWGYEHIVASF